MRELLCQYGTTMQEGIPLWVTQKMSQFREQIHLTWQEKKRYSLFCRGTGMADNRGTKITYFFN
jgi:hypothetical protein